MLLSQSQACILKFYCVASGGGDVIRATNQNFVARSRSRTLITEVFLGISEDIVSKSQGPHGGGGGGPTEVHILYPKKSQLMNLSTQKNHIFS